LTTPDTIKDALRACTTAAEVERVSGQYRADVLAMHKDPETRVFAVQIVNMKAYLLKWMSE